jgi:hypothetical protein
MSDPNIVRVNKTPYSWTSCSHFFSGLPYKGVRSVDFKESREKVEVQDAQNDGVPLGLTSGIYKIESLSFTLLRAPALALMADLATLTGTGSYGDAAFTYLLQATEPVTSPGMIADVPQSTLITGCQITGVDEKQEFGSDALVTEFTCKGLYIVRFVAGAPLTLFSQARALV